MTSLDLEKLKKAQAELQARMSRGGGSGVSLKFWKPSEGANRIRILPPWTSEGVHAGSFHREVHQHWNVSEEAKGPLLCPKKTPGAAEDPFCPICDFVDQLRQRKNDVQAQELVRNLRAKVAFLMSIIDLSDPVYTARDVAEFKKERPDAEPSFKVGDTKVQCYAATSTITEQIINIVLTSSLDITDLNNGHNIVLTKIGNRDKMKTRYTVMPELSKSKAPISADYKLPDLGAIGKVREYDELLKLLNSGPAQQFAGLLTAGSSDGNEAWGMPDEGDGEDLGASMRASLKG